MKDLDVNPFLWSVAVVVCCFAIGVLMRRLHPNAAPWRVGALSDRAKTIGRWNRRIGLAAAAVGLSAFPLWDLHPELMALCGVGFLAMLADVAIRRRSLRKN